jgi:NADH dehydrogenase/NADH:ubiquinone oxidoreductase subunit G
MATITIDEKVLEFDEPMTVLEAAKKLKIKIPTLCYNEYMTPYGGCRICMVEAAPRREDTNCILCGLCVRVCQQIPQRFALSFKERGIVRRVTSPFEKVAEACVGCGSCAYVCPTHTITVEEAS